jgi:GTP1/Obg family GTP-binding protein
MDYIFTEPASLSSILILFIGFLLLTIYLNYILTKRMKFSQLKKTSPVLIIGFPNSGRSFLVKELSKGKTYGYDKILNLNCASLTYDGTVGIEILDHQDVFLKDGKLNQSTLKELKFLDPRCIIAIIDVSMFGEPVSKQIEFIKKISEYFAGKKVFIVANKISKDSKTKIEEIKKAFGPDFYRVKSNRPEDVDKLRKDLIEFLIAKKY